MLSSHTNFRKGMAKRVGILSDTHGYWDERYATHFAECDEIWHCGDIGSEEVLAKLEAIKPVRAVYGNIDGQEIRLRTAKHQKFQDRKSTRLNSSHVT